MALRAAADHLALQHIEGGEQGRCAVPDVVVGHGAAPPLLDGQPWLGAVKRLDLALLVHREDDGMGRRIDVEPDDVAQLGANCGSLESLNRRNRCGWSPCARQMRRTELGLMPTTSAIAPA